MSIVYDKQQQAPRAKLAAVAAKILSLPQDRRTDKGVPFDQIPA
jgi:hypothetical protein